MLLFRFCLAPVLAWRLSRSRFDPLTSTSTASSAAGINKPLSVDLPVDFTDYLFLLNTEATKGSNVTLYCVAHNTEVSHYYCEYYSVMLLVLYWEVPWRGIYFSVADIDRYSYIDSDSLKMSSCVTFAARGLHWYEAASARGSYTTINHIYSLH